MIPDNIFNKLEKACNGDEQTFEILRNLIDYEDSAMKYKKQHYQQVIEEYAKENYDDQI